MFQNLTLLNYPTANLSLESGLSVFSQKIQQELMHKEANLKVPLGLLLGLLKLLLNLL